MILLCSFEAYGKRPVPWSVPDVGTGRARDGRRFRFARRPSKKLEEWQEFIAAAAQEAMAGQPAATEMVEVHCIFLARTPLGHHEGDLWAVDVVQKINKNGDPYWSKKSVKGQGQVPDLTNLVKGAEDAMEGIVYANDVLVRAMHGHAVYGRDDGIRVSVYRYPAVIAEMLNKKRKPA